MRVLGFSKTKSSSTLLVDNPENISFLFTGCQDYSSWFSSRTGISLLPLKKGSMPIFLMKFKSNYQFEQTAGKGYFVLVEKDTNLTYNLYSEGISQLIPLILSGKIPQDEDGYLTGLFIPIKIGSSVYLNMCDPDDLQLKEGF